MALVSAKGDGGPISPTVEGSVGGKSSKCRRSRGEHVKRPIFSFEQLFG